MPRSFDFEGSENMIGSRGHKWDTFGVHPENRAINGWTPGQWYEVPDYGGPPRLIQDPERDGAQPDPTPGAAGRQDTETGPEEGRGKAASSQGQCSGAKPGGDSEQGTPRDSSAKRVSAERDVAEAAEESEWHGTPYLRG